jgi:hypothetical protein
MDRQLVYTGAIPQTGDILKTNKAAMIGLGYALQAFLGPCSTPVVDGLAIAATLPASLSVTIGVGSIYSSQVVDQNAYSDLGTDTTHTVVKQGILQDPATLTVTPPGTAGYSQNYLVQVAFSEVDGGSAVLPYYNAANPSVPFAGPANAGTSNFTVRQGTVVVQLKAGTAATTGSQTTPSPDAGYVGLYVITVANGATSVTSGNFTTLSTAPFIPTKLPTLPGDVQSGKWVYAVATGTANAWVVAPTPALAAYAAGRVLWVKAPATNTATTVTVNISGLGTRPLKRSDGLDAQIGDLISGTWYPTIDDGTNVCIVSTLASQSRASAFKVQRTVITATGAYSFTVPSNVSTIRFSLWAAGGGGGSGGSGGASSGGSSGSYLQKSVDVTPGATITGTVGVGGAAGVWGGTINGTAGGNTTLVANAVTYTVVGGPGGIGQNGAGGANSPLAPTAPTQGDVNLQGGPGTFGINATSPNVASGNGANAPVGGLGGIGGAGSGGNGAAPGGGGGGGASGLAAGAGARGEVWIEY